MRRTFLVGVALLMLLLVPACGGNGKSVSSTPTTKPTPAQQWHAANITHYRFDYRPSCFCGPGDLRIEVRAGKVVRTSSLPTATGLPLPAGGEARRPTIDELLADLERAQTSPDRGEITATYDPRTGVPTEASIDWIKNAADDEMSWTITNFTAL